MGKKLAGAPHEVLLVIDATTGQNGISQAKLFDAAVDVTGITLTKLDGTSKGGKKAGKNCRAVCLPCPEGAMEVMVHMQAGGGGGRGAVGGSMLRLSLSDWRKRIAFVSLSPYVRRETELESSWQR